MSRIERLLFRSKGEKLVREQDWYGRPDWYMPRDWHFHWREDTAIINLKLKGCVIESAYDCARQLGWKDPVWYKPGTWNNWVK
jgi:hypothetical protein